MGALGRSSRSKLLWTAALVVLSSLLPQATAATAADPRRDMISMLEASGPHPALGEAARLFDRFVGTWDCDFAFHADDGTVSHGAGEVLVGWILDGRAVQDIWIGYPKPGSHAERTIGTTVRVFDAKAKLWRVVWVAASLGSIITLEGGAEGDRIVLRGKDTDGAQLRWSFNDITNDSFVWRGEQSRDGGKTWRLQEEHRMHRRGAPPL